MFKLTDKMIKEIESKVNKGFDDGIIERCSDLPDGSFVTMCEIIIDVCSGNVAVIDPVKTYDDDEDEEFDYGDIE
jgi:hypothetical protein